MELVRRFPCFALLTLGLTLGLGCSADARQPVDDVQTVSTFRAASSNPSASPDSGKPLGKLAASVASQAEVSAARLVAPEALGVAHVAAPVPVRTVSYRQELPPPHMTDDHFLDVPDRWQRDRLTQGQIVQVKKGSGGRSLGFKLTFADGSAGYYKPDQSFSGANWHAEVAAYHLDRELGLGRVPPVVSRRVAWNLLKAAAGRDYRVDEVHVQPNGTVLGALVLWLEGVLRPAVTPRGFENWLRIEGFAPWALSPYRRPSSYSDALRENKRRVRAGMPPILYYKEVPKPPNAELPAALSDMLIFDYLTLNIDRWGGHNGNVLTLGPRRTLIFLDNGAGFSRGPDTRGLMDDRLSLLQRFRKSTVRALKALSLRKFERRLDREELAPVLNHDLRAGLAVRRQKVLEHVAAMERAYGEQVYTW